MERIASFQTQTQKRTKKGPKRTKKIGRQQRKERKRAENVPENRATFITAQGDIFLFLAFFDSIAMDSRTWSLLSTLLGEVR